MQAVLVLFLVAALCVLLTRTGAAATSSGAASSTTAPKPHAHRTSSQLVDSEWEGVAFRSAFSLADIKVKKTALPASDSRCATPVKLFFVTNVLADLDGDGGMVLLVQPMQESFKKGVSGAVDTQLRPLAARVSVTPQSEAQQEELTSSVILTPISSAELNQLSSALPFLAQTPSTLSQAMCVLWRGRRSGVPMLDLAVISRIGEAPHNKCTPQDWPFGKTLPQPKSMCSGTKVAKAPQMVQLDAKNDKLPLLLSVSLITPPALATSFTTEAASSSTTFEHHAGHASPDWMIPLGALSGMVLLLVCVGWIIHSRSSTGPSRNPSPSLNYKELTNKFKSRVDIENPSPVRNGTSSSAALLAAHQQHHGIAISDADSEADLPIEQISHQPLKIDVTAASPQRHRRTGSSVTPARTPTHSMIPTVPEDDESV